MSETTSQAKVKSNTGYEIRYIARNNRKTGLNVVALVNKF